MSLKLSGTSVSFDAFHLSVDLEVHEREFISILGPSGSGKSTILKVIAGITEPDHGTVSLAGRQLTGVPMHKRKVGMVFQDYALFPHMNVYDNIAYGPRSTGMGSIQVKQRVDQMLDLVRLEHLANRSPQDLSGGEKQRVALARALAPEPEVLLLDEPLSALDAALRLEMRRELRRIHRELGLTMVYVTHDQQEAFALSDRISLIFDGHILQTASPKEVYASPATGKIAKFVGFENSIYGSVSMGDNKKAKFSAGGLSMITKPSHVTGKAELCFRPGDTFCVEADEQGQDLLLGTVIDAEFHGKGYSVQFEWNRQILRTVSTKELKPGDSIRVRIDAGRAVVFPDGA